tara:strand:- start:558 stop:779 length:222 start_codon:yes stop_codon:yes gene_type:complete
MSIDKKTLIGERGLLEKDFNATAEQIRQAETNLTNMKNNLNALHGAIQQIDKLLKVVDEGDEENKDGEIIQDS